jgi:hypothetical protein
MIGLRFESGFWIRPGGSARPATARLRRAWWGPILVRLSIRATPPCTLWRSWAKCFRGYATMRLSSGNLTQNRPKIFHLNSVPRHLSSYDLHLNHQ